MDWLTRFVLGLISRLLTLIEPGDGGVASISLADLPRRKGGLTVDIGNKFFDLVGGIHVILAPNGAIDSPPVVISDQVDFSVANQTVEGLEFDVLFPERDVPAYAITVTAPADNPSTPDLESVSLTITGSLSHSKATSLGATVTDLPR